MKVTRLWMLIQHWIDHQMWTPNQSQIARALGVHRSLVSQWKSGDARPNPEHLRDLSRLTGIPFIDLRTALVEDMGYTTRESEQSDDETSMNRAPVSGASEVTVHAETEDVPVNPQGAEVAGAQPPRPGPRAGRP